MHHVKFGENIMQSRDCVKYGLFCFHLLHHIGRIVPSSQRDNDGQSSSMPRLDTFLVAFLERGECARMKTESTKAELSADRTRGRRI